VTPDLDTLLIALYVEVDDHVIPSGKCRPGQPKRLSDAELVCLAVAQVLLGARSEHHWQGPGPVTGLAPAAFGSPRPPGRLASGGRAIVMCTRHSSQRCGRCGNSLGAIGGSITISAGWGTLSTVWAGFALTTAGPVLYVIAVPRPQAQPQLAHV
jgi:hypothetical protein